MHTFNETAAGVPAFLAKLWRLVEDPDTNHLIYWQQDGNSFVIQNQAQFARELLPLNYKHNNMASFIRQLNMYGFHKITSIDNGGLKFDKDEMEFMHACFRKDAPYLLEHIKRKIANPKPSAQAAAVAAAAAAAAAAADETRTVIRPETVTKVMNEVKTMRSRQESLDSRFSAMKQENEALWREVAILRQKHAKQQQIVNKLIQFLVTLVQPARPGSGINNNMSGVKRRFQLMINDVPESGKGSGSSASGAASSSSASAARKVNDDHMPAIRELTDELLDENEFDYDDQVTASPHVLSPSSHHSHNAKVEDVSSPMFDIDQSSTSIVDHPDSEDDDVANDDNEDDEDGDHAMYVQHADDDGGDQHPSNAPEDIAYMLSDVSVDNVITTTTSAPSPTQEWLEQHILSPHMIKQELQETASSDAVAINCANIDTEHTYTLPSSAATMPMAAKRGRRSLLGRSNGGLHLNIGGKTTGKGAVVQASQQQASSTIAAAATTANNGTATGNRNPMISGIASAEASIAMMPSTSRGTKRSQPPMQPPQQPSMSNTGGNSSGSVYYANKSDFISNEMPTELFDASGSTGGAGSAAASNSAMAVDSMSPLLGDLSSANFNPTLSEDYSKKVVLAMPSTANSAEAATTDRHMAVTKYDKANGKPHGADDVNMQLESIQGDLESIKELFRGDEYTLDTSALMGIFGDLDAPYGLSLTPDFPMDGGKRTEDPSGCELMTYQPNSSHVDLTQLLGDCNTPRKDDDDDDGNDEHQHQQLDYLDHDLNTPNVERKNVPFQYRHNN